MKILISTEYGELLYQYDSFNEINHHDNALISGLLSAIISLSREVVSSFPREIEFEGRMLYFYQENEYITAMLVDTDSPFKSHLLPLILADYKRVRDQYHFNNHDAIKYEKQITDAIRGCLAKYLSNIQKRMITILDRTQLLDYFSLLSLKQVAKEQSMKNIPDYLPIRMVNRLIPNKIDTLLFCLVMGIPIVFTGNKSIVELIIPTFQLLCPTRSLQVKQWADKYQEGFDIIGTNNIEHLTPNTELCVVNLDEGIIHGGKTSPYFQKIADQMKELSSIEAFSFMRSEMQWILDAFESLNLNKHKNSLPIEKQMVLYELLKRLS